MTSDLNDTRNVADVDSDIVFSRRPITQLTGSLGVSESEREGGRVGV